MLWHKLIRFAILILVLTQFEFVQSDFSVASCRNNFTRVGDKCVKDFPNWSNWYEADRHCRSLGAELLSLQNQTQLEQISKWLNINSPLAVWTSGNSLGQKGSYFWQSTGEQAHYLPWAKNEPKPVEGDCLTLSGDGLTSLDEIDYSLAVRNCNSLTVHVCEEKPQNFITRVCLKSGSYENVQVLA